MHLTSLGRWGCPRGASENSNAREIFNRVAQILTVRVFSAGKRERLTLESIIKRCDAQNVLQLHSGILLRYKEDKEVLTPVMP